ncbi:MAG: CPBP family intramembrane glutamic endopeptidase [Rhizomicrobium sp.]
MSVLLNGGNELLAHWKLVDFQDSDVERAIQPHTMPQIAVALGVIALFAPLAEEFFFRGLLLRWLSARGTALAVIVTALVFAAIHGQIFLHPGAQGLLFTAELFAAGVVLALWAIRTGSLRTSLATHAAYNATAVLFGVFFRERRCAPYAPCPGAGAARARTHRAQSVGRLRDRLAGRNRRRPRPHRRRRPPPCRNPGAGAGRPLRRAAPPPMSRSEPCAHP